MAWNPFGVLLEISASAGTVTRTSATQFTVKINAAWETYYSGAQTNYGMTASSGGGSVTLNPFGTKSSGGSGTLTGTYSISGNAGATKTIAVTFRNFNSDNGNSATKTVNLSVKVPAWTSYTVKYNANGGSGAPSSQTKWKDQTLTLSSVKPTRTGYTFQGWATSASDNVAYAAGGSYTANAAVTLYAVWKANTYIVTYNFNGGYNGGGGFPNSQTKTHDIALTLSSGPPPYRSGYTFKGWGTSASATTVAYALGATYTANENITLYAIWGPYSAKARITNLSVKRCDADGTLKADGTYALVSFDWASDNTATKILLEWKTETAEAYTSSLEVAVSGTSGTVSQIIGVDDSLIGTWVFNDELTINDTNAGCSMTFTSNGVEFGGMTFGNLGPPLPVVRYQGSNVPIVYAYEQESMYGFTPGWQDEAYKTIEITNSSSNSDNFISWFKANATKQGSELLDITSSYTIRVTVQEVTGKTTTVTKTLNSLLYTLHGKAGGDGIAFGKTSELGAAESLGGNGVADFAFDAKFNQPVYGNVLGLNKLPAIPAGSELNDYMETGCWAIQSNAIAATITCGGVPLGTDDSVPPAKAGRLEVSSSTGEGIRAEQWSYLRQRFIPYNSTNPIFERDIARGADNVWQYYEWWKSTLTPAAAQKVYAKAAATISLSANVTLGVASSYTKIPFNTLAISTSDRLTLESNSIRIGANITHVKVSGQTLVKCGSQTGNRHARIQKVSGSTTTSIAWDCIYGVGTANTLYPFTPVIVPVKEGDLLFMVYYTGDATDSNVSGSAANGWQSYLTVEEL